MRTTLDIDDDVLAAAKELARRQRQTMGAVVSELARRGLTMATGVEEAGQTYGEFHGFRPFGRRTGVVVTNALIDKLRDDGAY